MLTFKKMIRETVRPFKRFARPSKCVVKLKAPPTYNQDWLVTCHDCSFMQEPTFMAAYQRGIQAAGQDYRFHWRVHVALWAASQASKIEGAFVECGVNKGFLASAIMNYLQWNTTGRHFYLFDTFCGFDYTQLTEEERQRNARNYDDCYEEVRKNFQEFQNVHLIRGSVPASLAQADISKVAYLSIDMNCVTPEIAAANYFWPKMAKGGMIVLDDYAYVSMTPQKQAFDAFAKEHDTQILALPTGQGLMIAH